MTVNSLGIHNEQDRTTRTAAEWLWALLPIGISVFCLSALVYYHVNHDEVQVASTLQVAVSSLYRSLGFAPACMFFLLLLTWSSIWFVTGGIEQPVGRLLRLGAMTIMLGVFMNLGDGGVTPAFHKGELGAWLAGRLVATFGYYPSLVLVWAATFASMLLATDYFFSDRFERLRAGRQAAEGGVEVEVTDHLKALQEEAVAPAVEPLAVAAVEPVPSAPAAAAEAPAPNPLLDGLAAEDRPRRRSYFERRYEVPPTPAPRDQVAPGAAEPEVDEWVPTGPETQEIDDVELGEPMATASGPVGVSSADDFVLLGETAHELAAEGAWEPVGAPEEPPQFEPLAGEVPAPAETPAEPPAEAAETPEIVVEADFVAGRPAPAEVPAAEAVDSESVGETASAEEPVVAIPRPEPLPAAAADEVREPVRQQRLFGPAIDETLVAEAAEVVTTWRRASATFLQRKLRVDYEVACQVLVELAARGVVELEGDASRARVLR